MAVHSSPTEGVSSESCVSWEFPLRFANTTFLQAGADIFPYIRLILPYQDVDRLYGLKEARMAA